MASGSPDSAAQTSMRFVVTVVSTPDPITIDVIASRLGRGWCLNVSPPDGETFDMFVPSKGLMLDWLGELAGIH